MLPGVEGGCSHVAMSSGEHEDEHDEVLSGVAAMESAWLELRAPTARRDGETSLRFASDFSQRLNALTPARVVSALSL